MIKSKDVTISAEDLCECNHKRIEHTENGCNHGRYGRGDYPCLCIKFRIKGEKDNK